MQKRNCIHIENQAKNHIFQKKRKHFQKEKEEVGPIFQWWHTTVKDNFVDVNFDVPTFVMKMDIYF